MLNNLRLKFNKYNNNYKFEASIALLFMVFGMLAWKVNYALGAIPVILISAFLMVLYDDFKYGIPSSLVLLFSYGKGFEVEHFPFDIVIPVLFYVIFVLGFTIYHFKKEKLKHLKSCIGMIVLSISFIIPIFWSTLVTKEFVVFYIMYFSWLMYTILYILMCFNLNKNSFRMMVFSFSSLTLLLGFELALELYRLHTVEPDRSILSFTYYIGWGLCNEAGIIICFCMPFIFYELIKSKSIIISLFSIFKIFLCLGFIFITNSRGGLLFGGIEFISLFIVLFFIKFDMKKIKITYIVILLSIVLSIGFRYAITNDLFESIKNTIFKEGLDSNGRTDMWLDAINIWKSSFRNVVFGSGIVSEIKELSLYHEVAESFVVYHSTIFEVLVSAGLIGFIGLIIHLYEKYKMVFKKGIVFGSLLLIGYIVVDLYGMIDNTYGMYYYMVPLAILMATLRHSKNLELYNDKKLELF